MYEHQDAKLPSVFESLPDSVVAALGLIMPEPPTIPVEKLEEKKQVRRRRPRPEMSLSSLMKSRDAILRQAHYGFAIVLTLKSKFNVRGLRYRRRSCIKISDSVC